jgi:hypothetical protein
VMRTDGAPAAWLVVQITLQPARRRSRPYLP